MVVAGLSGRHRIARRSEADAQSPEGLTRLLLTHQLLVGDDFERGISTVHALGHGYVGHAEILRLWTAIIDRQHKHRSSADTELTRRRLQDRNRVFLSRYDRRLSVPD